MNDVEEFLEHFGKKGMKWGVRNRIQTSKTPKKTSGDYKRAAELRKKKHPQLSNKQIEEANKRANLEQNFNRLNPDKIKRGQNHIKEYMALVGTATAAFSVINSKAGKAFIDRAKKHLSKNRNRESIALKTLAKKFY